MPYVRDSFWRGREFTSLTQMQAAAADLVGGGGRAAQMPAAGRRRPGCGVRRRRGGGAGTRCPATFVLATWSRAKVGPDFHIKVGRALYSVPWRLIGQKVDVRATATIVQVFSGGEVVATHVPPWRGKGTDFGHYPPEKIAFHMRNPTWCRRQAAKIGPATGGDRRSDGSQRDAPAPLRARDPRPGRPARPRPGWKPPAPGRSQSATRPTAPSKASSPPGPKPSPRPGHWRRRGRRVPARPAQLFAAATEGARR